MSLHESFWTYRRWRYLKASLLVVVVAVSAYLADDPPGGARGGTVLGYTLGAICLVLVIWLMLFGARKRAYAAKGAPLRGWLSAHVYLGLTLLVLVPLHSGFQFGWNVHTLAFVLIVAVVLTGTFGVSVYMVVPEKMTENRPGEKLASLFERVDDIDTDCRSAAQTLPDTIARAVASSVSQTKVGGGLLRQLSGRDPRCPTTAALMTIASEAPKFEGHVREEIQKVLELLDHKRSLLRRIRRDTQLKALLDVWLVMHVPLAVAACAAVAAHVLIVFYYF